MIIYHITFYTIIPPILSYPDIYSSEVVQTRFIFSSKYSYIMSKMIGIRQRYMAVLKKFTQNNRQHCSTKFGKKPKIATFRCFKTMLKLSFRLLEIWNFSGRWLNRLRTKFKFQEYQKLCFLEPLFYDRLSWYHSVGKHDCGFYTFYTIIILYNGSWLERKPQPL